MQPEHTEHSEHIIDLRQGQAAMFGYGSLLLQSNMELTLGRPCSQMPVACGITGWRRSWDVIMPNRSFYELSNGAEFIPQNIVYLNVRPSNRDVANGLLYILEPEQLEAFDRREWIYNRHEITQALSGVTVVGGHAYVYVAKPEWRLVPGRTRKWAAVRGSYLKVIDEGLKELGPEFRAQYENSTDPVPTHLVFTDRKRKGTHPLLADAAS